MHRYDLLAIDLDGTLLNDRKEVSSENRRAIRDAQRAGIRVVVCTGRGLAESRDAIECIGQRDPVVVVGGAMVACPVRQRALHRFTLDPAVAGRATERLLDHGWPVMLFKDASQTGYEYLLVVGSHQQRVDPATTWWFAQMGVRVRTCRRPEEDEHPQHTLRVGVCGPAPSLAPVTSDMKSALGEAATMHQFPAVLDPDATSPPPHILEIFHPRANKWSAVRWLADQHRIDPRRVAAIGDEINDLPMIRHAGLGIAMENAVPEVRNAAARRTTSNNDDGVARAIDAILEGRW